MSKYIESVEGLWSGETLHLDFVVWDGEERKDMTGADVEWQILNPYDNEAVLDGTDDGVTIEMTDPDDGEFEVRLDGVTDGLGSQSYDERLRIKDSDGRVSIFGGSLEIQSTDF